MTLLVLQRHPHYAEPMNLARYIEKVGTGTLDMIARSKQAGLAPPKFVQEQGQVKQKLFRPVSLTTPEVIGEVTMHVDHLKKAYWKNALPAHLPTSMPTPCSNTPPIVAHHRQENQ